MPPSATAPIDPATFRHVHHRWDDAHAQGLSPLDRLVYRSNLLGADQRVTNTGGGNTSSKAQETDPVTGDAVDVLWVKGSGGDLRTSGRGNFSSLYQDGLLKLREQYLADPKRGLKTPAEDDMVGRYKHVTFNLNPRASSIDTPLHSYLPARHVDHMHPTSVIAIAACSRAEEIAQKVYGARMGYVPWMRPGVELGLAMQSLCEQNPEIDSILMGGHGLINWHDDDKACYELTLSLIEQAARYLEEHDRGDKTFGGPRFNDVSMDRSQELAVAILPWLRGRVSQQQRFIGTWDARPEVLRFVQSNDAERLAELGTSCPDHFLRTKIKPLYVPWDPASGDLDALKKQLDEGLDKYRADYAAYYEACKRPDSPAMRDPNPTVVLIPGIGMLAWGKSKSESRVTAEFYGCAVEVMRGAEAVDQYVALPRQEAFDIEYWALEEAKLQRMPKEKDMARRVVAVLGGGSGIGKEACAMLAEQDASVVAIDLNPDAAQAAADALTQTHGQGIGVAGTDVSGCGPAIGVSANATDRASLRTAYQTAVLAYGGVDHLVVTAGVFVPPDKTGRIPDDQWDFTFGVNVKGVFLAVDEAAAVLREQDLTGSVVITTSVNAVVAKKGSLAYDTSKAAANHLVRELAVELAPKVRVNAVAPATVIQGSTMFPRDRVIASLTKYAVAFDESEDDDTLRTKLAEFYAQRTLTRSPITPKDQAQGICFLLGPSASKTTGQVLHVDGGLQDAFLR
ncbi:MAG: bifunctional rhamnulose-1-phosphate aldolase/short-chain dehydrogenase [Planctomycetota bacterium]